MIEITDLYTIRMRGVRGLRSSKGRLANTCNYVSLITFQKNYVASMSLDLHIKNREVGRYDYRPREV